MLWKYKTKRISEEEWDSYMLKRKNGEAL